MAIFKETTTDRLRRQMEEFQERAERVKRGEESKGKFLSDVIKFLKEEIDNAST